MCNLFKMKDYFETRATNPLEEVLLEIGGSLSCSNYPFMVMRLDEAMELLGEVDATKVSKY